MIDSNSKFSAFTNSNSGDNCGISLSQCEQALDAYQAQGQYLDAACELDRDHRTPDGTVKMLVFEPSPVTVMLLNHEFSGMGLWNPSASDV